MLERYVKAKQKEFFDKGYHGVAIQDIWDYLYLHLWKKEKPKKNSAKKQQITEMTENDFFDYQQICAQVKENETFNWKKINDLF